MPVKLKFFIILALVFAVGSLGLAELMGQMKHDWMALALFAALILVTDSFSSIKLPKVGQVSVAFPIFLGCIILFGPVMTALAGAFGALTSKDGKNSQHLIKRVFNLAQVVSASTLGGLVYVGTGGPVLAELGRGFGRADFPAALLPIALSITTFFVTNTILVSVVIAMAEGMSPIKVWLMNVGWAIPNYFALSPLGLAVAQIYMIAGDIGVILIIVPLIIARKTFQVYVHLRNTYMDTIRSLIAALEAKDPYTRGHSERVARLAEAIGEKLKLQESDLETLRYAGVLHDIGKIGIARHILRKPGKLTEDEYQRLKLHPESGALILREIRFLNKVVPVIFHHHEHFDGTGYIDGIEGVEIPLLARILAVADAYDAMTSPRPYRPAMDQEKACRELVDCAGTQFDPTIVEVFLATLDYSPEQSPDLEGQLQLDGTTA